MPMALCCNTSRHHSPCYTRVQVERVWEEEKKRKNSGVCMKTINTSWRLAPWKSEGMNGAIRLWTVQLERGLADFSFGPALVLRVFVLESSHPRDVPSFHPKGFRPRAERSMSKTTFCFRVLTVSLLAPRPEDDATKIPLLYDSKRFGQRNSPPAKIPWKLEEFVLDRLRHCEQISPSDF